MRLGKLNAYGTLRALEPVWYPEDGYPGNIPFTEEQYRALHKREVESEIAQQKADTDLGGWIGRARNILWVAGQNAPVQGSFHHHCILVANALDAMVKKLMADEIVEVTPTTPFTWVEDGENADAPKWLLKYGDYVGKVNKDYGSGLWNYRVDNSGRLGFETADEAKEAAETDLKSRLAYRLKSATETLAIFGKDGNVLGA